MSDVEKQEPISIATENVVEQVKALPNWKTPGTDGIQGYWIKHLKSLHDRIGNHLNECIIQGSVPDWIVEGRTTLIMKDPAKAIAAENYRPITCLNLLWVAQNLIHLLSISMSKWKKKLIANKKPLGSVAVKRGIFQGDSFSPLLFVIALVPISMALRKINMGYKLGKNAPSLNHLF